MLTLWRTIYVEVVGESCGGAGGRGIVVDMLIRKCGGCSDSWDYEFGVNESTRESARGYTPFVVNTALLNLSPASTDFVVVEWQGGSYGSDREEFTHPLRP